jgi:DNA repair exonuclease SbcCD ATPase subunit
MFAVNMPDVAVHSKSSATKLENQIQTLKNDDSANAIRREIAEIETKIAEGRNRYTAGINAENEKFQNGITRLETELREKERKRDDSADVRQHIESQIADLTERKTRKLAAWHSANDRVWTGSDTCPTCGQKLPPEQIESAKAKFNKQRSDDLEQLVTEGKAFAKKIEENQAAITEKNTVLETLTTEITTLESRIEKGKSMLKPCAYETQIEYKQLSGRLVDLKNQLAKGTDTEKSGKMDALAAQLSNVKQQIQDADRVKLQIEQAEAQKKHVAELQDQQKKIAADLGNYEKAVALCEDHVKKQARALETAVNGKFKVARFRMFAPQKNHEEAECCDVVYPERLNESLHR